jgi:hypothetical protein
LRLRPVSTVFRRAKVTIEPGLPQDADGTWIDAGGNEKGTSTFCIIFETGNQLISRDCRCPKLADHNGASVVGDFGRFNRRRLASESQGEESNSSIAGARDIENLARPGWDIMRRFLLLKEHHAVFTERDENILCFPFFESKIAYFLLTLAAILPCKIQE